MSMTMTEIDPLVAAERRARAAEANTRAADDRWQRAVEERDGLIKQASDWRDRYGLLAGLLLDAAEHEPGTAARRALVADAIELARIWAKEKTP